MPTTPSASAILIVAVLAFRTGTDTSGFSDNHLFYALRLIGALGVATAVPLLIDRRARRSNRIGQ